MAGLYQLYIDAVNNNDGEHVDSIVVNGKPRELYMTTNSRWSELCICVDEHVKNDLSVAIYDINGDVLFKNNNLNYLEQFK